VSEPYVRSPCINICRIEAATRLCEGCRRSLDEIVRWRGMTAREKQEVIATLPSRPAFAGGPPMATDDAGH